MKIAYVVLVLVIVAELFVGGSMLTKQETTVVPPEPPLHMVDDLTASELREIRSQHESSSSASWLNLADAYAAFGFTPEAAVCYAHASEMRAANGEPYDVAAGGREVRCLARLGRVEDAAAKQREVIEHATDEQAIGMWFDYGRLMLRLEREDEASAAFEKAKTYPPTCVEQARILMRHGKADEAAALLDPAIAKMPRERHPLRFRAYAAAARDETMVELMCRTRARISVTNLDVYTKPKELDDARSAFGLAQLSERAQEALAASFKDPARRGEAYRQIKERLAVEWSPYPSYAMAAAMIQARVFDQARDVCADIIEHEGETYRVLELLGDIDAAEGNEEQAIEFWKRAVLQRPSPRTYHRLTLAYRERGDEAEMKHWQVLGMTQSAVEEFRKGNLKTALEFFQKAVELDPDNARAWYYASLTFILAGQPDQAMNAATNAVKADANYGRAIRLKAALDKIESDG